MMTNEERRRREAFLARKQRRRRRRNIQIAVRCALGCGVLLAVVFIAVRIFGGKEGGSTKPEGAQVSEGETEIAPGFKQKVILEAPDYKVNLLTPNEYSRPQTELKKVKGIVIHYTANPGTTADQNRSYFESLKDSRETKASSHFVIGIDGEIVQCIPSAEISYASNDRNSDTLSIECCHKDKTGQFTQETYDTLVELTAWLCGKFNLPVDNVIRHFDVTGKECPIYYVENEDAWVRFKKDVQKYLDTHGVEQEEKLS